MASDRSARPADDPPSLPGVVRAWRERALLTQEQLADLTGLGVRTIRRLESGVLRRPRGHSVQLLAGALGLSDQERALLVALAVPGAGEIPPGAGLSGTGQGHPAGQRPAAAADRPGAAVPRQLPADVSGFAGRGDHLRELDKLADAGAAGAVVISAIAGTAGVGKTALAVHWAHRVAARFPGGQLYVNLRGFDPGGVPTDPASAVRGFLDALGVAPGRVPSGLDAQAALYRSLVADRRVLVVLDNAADADQVRPLLPGSPGCLAVVTSREQLTGLVATVGAYSLLVDLMPVDEARELLERRIGDRASGEPDAVDEIIDRCARLPLPLAVVAARAAGQPGLRLADVAAELRDLHHRLDAYATGDAMTDVRAVFQWSYRRLTAPAARLFRLLGVHPGPDVSTVAAASLAGEPGPRTRRALAELSRAHLVAEPRPGRYVLHDLLRAYAAELAGAVDGPPGTAEARRRLLDHYLHSAYASARALHPLRTRFTPDGPAPGVAPETPADERRAQEWLFAEHKPLVAAVGLAGGHGFDTHAYQLAWCLTDFLDWRGHWDEWAAVQQVAVEAARRLGDPAAQALAHRGLAGAHYRRGDYETAYLQLRHALDVAGEGADPTERAQAHVNLATVRARQRRYDEALAHGREALRLYRAAGNRVGEGDALLTVGTAYGFLGDDQRAVAHLEEALAVARELDNREGLAGALDSLGQTRDRLGDHAGAVACYDEAVALCRQLGNRYYEAAALHHLGDARRAAGELPAAHRAWRAALDILDDLDHPEAGEVRAKLAPRLQPRTDP